MHWRDLEVWKQAHAMTLETYKLTEPFPEVEKFRLTSQLCRSASSVAANIVEGNARQSTKEYIQFLVTARASLEETRYFALLARDLGYIEASAYQQFESRGESISRMLNAMVRTLKKRSNA